MCSNSQLQQLHVRILNQTKKTAKKNHKRVKFQTQLNFKKYYIREFEACAELRIYNQSQCFNNWKAAEL